MSEYNFRFEPLQSPQEHMDHLRYLNDKSMRDLGLIGLPPIECDHDERVCDECCRRDEDSAIEDIATCSGDE